MNIVTLLPSATEIVCALGLNHHLVAVSHECDYPPAVNTLPSITSSTIPKNLSLRQIDDEVVKAVHEGRALYTVKGDLLNALSPDLIITQGVCDVCAVNEGTVQEALLFLADAIPSKIQVLSLTGTNFAGILRDIRLVASATDTMARASALITQLQTEWQRLQQNQPKQKPRVLMLEWPEPPFFGGHWVPEMVNVAGGLDVMGQPGLDSGRCTWEQIAAEDPDIIVVIACGYDLAHNITFTQELMARPEICSVRAIQTGQLWAGDANSYFSRPGPRIVAGAAILQSIFCCPYEPIVGACRVMA